MLPTSSISAALYWKWLKFIVENKMRSCCFCEESFPISGDDLLEGEDEFRTHLLQCKLKQATIADE
jgi:hypothetical protein